MAAPSIVAHSNPGNRRSQGSAADQGRRFWPDFFQKTDCFYGRNCRSAASYCGNMEKGADLYAVIAAEGRDSARNFPLHDAPKI
jgi:hypothetical protein